MLKSVVLVIVISAVWFLLSIILTFVNVALNDPATDTSQIVTRENGHSYYSLKSDSKRVNEGEDAPMWFNAIYKVVTFPMRNLQGWDNINKKTDVICGLAGVFLNSLFWGILLVFFYRFFVFLLYRQLDSLNKA